MAWILLPAGSAASATRTRSGVCRWPPICNPASAIPGDASVASTPDCVHLATHRFNPIRPETRYAVPGTIRRWRWHGAG